MLFTIIFKGKVERLVITIEFEVVAGGGIFEEVGTTRRKRFEKNGFEDETTKGFRFPFGVNTGF